VSVLLALRALTLTTAILSLAAFGIADEKPFVLLLGLVVSLISWGMMRVEPARVLPRAVLNLMVGAATLYLVLALLSSGQDTVISSLTDFLALVLMIKMLDRASMRDEAQLMTLSVFVVIGSVLSGAQLALGAVLVLYTPLMIAAVVLWQVAAGHERAAQRARAVGVETPAGARGERIMRPLLTTIVLAVGLTLVTGVVAFVVTPRAMIPGITGQWGRPMPGATTGYHEQIQLGNAGLISQSGTPVGEVRLLSARGEPLGPADQPLYLRGTTLDLYDPRTGLWKRSSTETRQPPGSLRDDGSLITLQEPSRLSSRAPIFQEVTLRSGRQNQPIFAALMPVSVRFPGGTGDGIKVYRADGTLSRSSASTGQLSYLVESRADYIDPSPPPVMTDEPRPVQEGETSPEPATVGSPFTRPGPIRDLALTLLGQAGVSPDPAKREAPENRRAATVFLNHLRGFEYTLEMVAPEEGQDPLQMFLFTTRRGHCEYFAAGMVALCQSVGLPARIVTGYVSGEYNAIGGHYVVRESDAHAWVEVLLQPGRWETFDPTPPDSLQHVQRGGGGVLGWLRRLYDAIEFSWASNVISFDSQRRAEIINWNPQVGDPTPLYNLRRSVNRATSWLRGLMPEGVLGSVLTIVLGVCLIAGAGIMVWVVGRGLARRWRAGRGAGQAEYTLVPPELVSRLAFYPRMLEMLARRGRGKPDSVPPMTHAAALAQSDPRMGELVGSVADRYYRIRFGRDDAAAPDPELNELRARLDDLPPARRR
jgi:transglutaminase-like putative cysteine protease